MEQNSGRKGSFQGVWPRTEMRNLTFTQVYLLLCSIGAFTLYTLSWWFDKPLDVQGLFIGVFAIVSLAVHFLADIIKNGKNGNDHKKAD